MDVFDEAEWVAARTDGGYGAELETRPVDVAQEGRKGDVTAFVASVYCWADDADQAGDEQRQEAAQRILQCWETNATLLDLRNLRLSTLPAGLWMLNRAFPGRRSNARFHDGPLPVREASEPVDAGVGVGVRLRQLFLDGNRLRVLPERIASLSSLRHLSLAHNRLTGLPEGLQQLPALSYLNVAANDLEALPDALGKIKALEVLRADGCLLRWIAPSLGALPLLRELDVSDNGLTSLPDTIRWLPTACVVRLHDNPLPARVRHALRAGPSAPVWLFDDAPPKRFSRTLDEAAFAWLIAGADRCRRSLDAWRCLADDHPDAARALIRLLDALGTLPEASNSDTRRAFRTSVRDTLKQIEADPSGLVRHLAQSGDGGEKAGERPDVPLIGATDDRGDAGAALADTGFEDQAGRRDAQTRARWARAVVSLSGGRDVADVRDATDEASDGDVARAKERAASYARTGSMRDETRERALRRWIDRYVRAYPFLDWADVLHACRMAIDHAERHGRLLPLPRATAARQRDPSTKAGHPIAPALRVMSEEDLADCLRALPSGGLGGSRIAQNRAERGNCVG